MPRITFQPAGVTVEVSPGTSILEAARQADVPIRNDCGGQGVCGRCLVEVQRGEVRRRPTRHELPPERSLACRTDLQEADVEVLVPGESRQMEVRVSVERAEPFPEHYPPSGAMVEKVNLQLNPPDLDDNLDDRRRLIRHLGQWRQGDYHVPLAVLSDLPRRLREADWQAEVTLSVEPWGHRVLHVGPPDGAPVCMAAVDIGTTAIKARLLAPGAGAMASSYNSQVMFGSDVISRIMHCQRDPRHGCRELKQTVVRDINRLLEALLAEADLAQEDLWGMTVSGNTSMIHLFLGLEPAWIRRDPYVGCAYRPPPVRPEDVGVAINPGGRVFCLPSVSSFVGADITAGILATGLAQRPLPAALIDLGTNGEIAIGCEEFLVCCSASAGPAFEGGGSASGTRAKEGAVDSVWSENGSVRYKTIGEAPAEGICGTGYIDLLATLLREGVMDKTGALREDAPHVQERDGELLYELVAAEDAAGDRPVVLTQADVDNLVRAKGAIYAAARVMLENLGMEWGDLGEIMLAGGFGESLDKDNAITIGLLPDVPREQVQFVGNTSLKGAVMAAEDADSFWAAADIATRMTYFELSTHPDFMDQFVSACFLPHTDTEKFPSVSVQSGQG